MNLREKNILRSSTSLFAILIYQLTQTHKYLKKRQDKTNKYTSLLIDVSYVTALKQAVHILGGSKIEMIISLTMQLSRPVQLKLGGFC